ncbi:hypothetical protein MKW98_022039 [Papaver atlanticum]|uniref:glutamine synthetase n=1 Tax=Papaver atlanticum TaxID=357466 RepID=A0AAD4TKS8_9MAGN|nr:hypothetical protein MKW98_022039 [Papaver atlanticum]
MRALSSLVNESLLMSSLGDSTRKGTGIELKYTLLPVGGFPGPQGPSVQLELTNPLDETLRLLTTKLAFMLGLTLLALLEKAMPGQWEYQVGPGVAIEVGDIVWCSRHILERTKEQAGGVLSLDSKPVEGDWNGAGRHTTVLLMSLQPAWPMCSPRGKVLSHGFHSLRARLSGCLSMKRQGKSLLLKVLPRLKLTEASPIMTSGIVVCSLTV